MDENKGLRGMDPAEEEVFTESEGEYEREENDFEITREHEADDEAWLKAQCETVTGYVEDTRGV